MRTGDRYNPVNLRFYRAFKKDTGLEIDYNTFKNIIWNTNEEMRKAIIEDETGIKLPENLGHIVVTKYKSNHPSIDWVNTRKYKKVIPLLNLHSFGCVHHIKWYTIGCGANNIPLYKIKPARNLGRGLAKSIKSGKQYFKWEGGDFWSITKMERSFEKRFKKQQREDTND